MKLYIKQQVFSWTDRFFIKDEYENDRFYAEGEFFSWGKKLHIYDLTGNEVAFIKQKVLSWMPCYTIEIGGQAVCEVKQEFTFFKQEFSFNGLPWKIEGDFWAHEYTLHDGYKSIMQMSKHWFTWGDSYELTIHEPQNELIGLCAALAIDCAVAESENLATS